MRTKRNRGKNMGQSANTGGQSADAGGNLGQQMAQLTSVLMQPSSQTELLDIVDSLRSHGVSHYVDLPQIIVCGSQSSGKSATLESISGIAFPTAEGLCTRFATELVMRRGDGEPTTKVHIQPGARRSQEERAELEAFSLETAKITEIPQIFERAREAMGLTEEKARMFSTDVLRVEFTSPDVVNLTLVDLPGLFTSADKNQSDDDATLVQELVTGYMKQRRSVILAVVSADNPFANQPVTKFTRDIDREGRRTLGLITKPDKLEAASESERYYVDLAHNANVRLKLGWHVLRNRSHVTSDDTSEERDEREGEFFQKSVWSSLDPAQLGVERLREKLSKVLVQQIKDVLPGVKVDVQNGIKECRATLEQLGAARETSRSKHTYLQRISSRLTTLVRAALDGVYADQFFASYPRQEDGLDRRLRANVQKILLEYADKMRLDGHALEVVEDHMRPERREPSRFTTRAKYLETVKLLMVECRGRELPGTFNPLVVADLFSRQCKPWESITHSLVEQIHSAAVTTFHKITADVCDKNTRKLLMAHHIQPALHRLRMHLNAKIDELLEPHLAIHPITYNDALTTSVQKIQEDRHKKMFDGISMRTCGFTAKQTKPKDVHDVVLHDLLFGLRDGTKPNVEEYSASLAADVAAAYYDVALKKFIDDVSVNAVETCLIQRLPEVLSPDVIWDLTDKTVELLGSEDAGTIESRIETTKKLQILEKGLRDLDDFTLRSGSGGSARGSRYC